MAVGPQGTTCLFAMDFNVGHVFVWLCFFSGFVYYDLASFKPRLLSLQTVTGHIFKVVHVGATFVNLVSGEVEGDTLFLQGKCPPVQS